jgi:hypothetical protein
MSWALQLSAGTRADSASARLSRSQLPRRYLTCEANQLQTRACRYAALATDGRHQTRYRNPPCQIPQAQGRCQPPDPFRQFVAHWHMPRFTRFKALRHRIEHPIGCIMVCRRRGEVPPLLAQRAAPRLPVAPSNCAFVVGKSNVWGSFGTVLRPENRRIPRAFARACAGDFLFTHSGDQSDRAAPVLQGRSRRTRGHRAERSLSAPMALLSRRLIDVAKTAPAKANRERCVRSLQTLMD